MKSKDNASYDDNFLIDFYVKMRVDEGFNGNDTNFFKLGYFNFLRFYLLCCFYRLEYRVEYEKDCGSEYPPDRKCYEKFVRLTVENRNELPNEINIALEINGDSDNAWRLRAKTFEDDCNNKFGSILFDDKQSFIKLARHCVVMKDTLSYLNKSNVKRSDEKEEIIKSIYHGLANDLASKVEGLISYHQFSTDNVKKGNKRTATTKSKRKKGILNAYYSNDSIKASDCPHRAAIKIEAHFKKKFEGDKKLLYGYGVDTIEIIIKEELVRKAREK